MTGKKLLALVALCAVMLVVVGLFPGAADAQDSKAATKVDKSIANKRGVSDSLASKKDDEGGGATKSQMAIGIGSIIVMIIVVKWL